ncbi:hypothetical protein G8770_06905 [Aestuariicella hydrocarbonica]|uniref:tRNA 2-thiouridine synthesizing protein C n=1 Tax=Pseudomaricurvus hydrocarbonicus TaxID=1470433 RepID=A0A9E5JTZ7_9GAMM|nr:DsrH/TusB family sulfur metabolism protein [Aestuariicella hydrocarbonica]NHO65269.1 hypothetical protein [Aestuariicella hydrocarbonica]
MKILFIIKRPPSDRLFTRDSIDAILTCSVFDQQIALLFMEDGVLQLTPEADNQELKEQLGLLAMYGVQEVYALRESLVSRQLDQSHFILPTQCIDHRQAGQLIASHDTVFHF